MERILIEIRGGCIINIIGTTNNLSIEILDHDWDCGSEHSINGVDSVKTDQELTEYIFQQTAVKQEEE